MISNMFDKSLVRILSFFLISPGSRYKRLEIKEKVKMNNVPLDNSLNKLISLGILEVDKGLFNINNDSEFREIIEYIRKEYKGFDVPYEIFNVLVEISEGLSRLRGVRKVYLFGSYAKLIYSDKSDIDIAVVFEDSVKRIKDEKDINKEIKRIRGKYKRKIEVHFFLEKDMKEKDSLVKDILRNGKKLF